MSACPTVIFDVHMESHDVTSSMPSAALVNLLCVLGHATSDLHRDEIAKSTAHSHEQLQKLTGHTGLPTLHFHVEGAIYSTAWKTFNTKDRELNHAKPVHREASEKVTDVTPYKRLFFPQKLHDALAVQPHEQDGDHRKYLRQETLNADDNSCAPRILRDTNCLEHDNASVSVGSLNSIEVAGRTIAVV